jgi:transposase
MLTWPSGTKVFASTRPTDMRCGFDSLAHQVRQFLGHDPLSGHLFVFRNRRGDRLKILYWDRDGLVLWYKRLEQGTFRLPPAPSVHPDRLELTADELGLILQGIDPTTVSRSPRYQRPNDSS